MPRPPLPIGTYGNITTHAVPGGFRATARFRDHDGVTRKVEKNGATAAIAKNRLRDELRDRVAAGQPDDISGDSRFSAVADAWLLSIESQVAQGVRSPNTAQIYRLTLDVHVRPALGEVRLREISVSRLDRFVQTVNVQKGAATAKLARTVLSGALGLAVRYGAIRANPTRDIGRIATTPRRQPRALTREEREEWIKQLHADPVSRRKDLPDLCAFMLATGVRIGEALAVAWDDVDLDGRLVVIEHTIIRVKGQGLVRKTTKSLAGERTLRLPGFAMGMLRRRQQDSVGRGPVFPDGRGGWRDPSNASGSLRTARGSADFAWVTSHVFRKTAATELDAAGLSARQIADQLGHAKVSMTQDKYLGRRAVTSDVADALDRAYGGSGDERGG